MGFLNIIGKEGKRQKCKAGQSRQSHLYPVRPGGNPEKSTWSWVGRPPIEYDTRRRSRMLAYRGEKKGGVSQQLVDYIRHIEGGRYRLKGGVLTPTGAVTRICCVSVAPGLTSGRDMGCICNCCVCGGRKYIIVSDRHLFDANVGTALAVPPQIPDDM